MQIAFIICTAATSERAMSFISLTKDTERRGFSGFQTNFQGLKAAAELGLHFCLLLLQLFVLHATQCCKCVAAFSTREFSFILFIMSALISFCLYFHCQKYFKWVSAAFYLLLGFPLSFQRSLQIFHTRHSSSCSYSHSDCNGYRYRYRHTYICTCSCRYRKQALALNAPSGVCQQFSAGFAKLMLNIEYVQTDILAAK